MTTETAPQPATTPTATATPTNQWLVGDYYNATATSTLDEVADRICHDLDDVKFDGLLPTTAVCDVTADTGGPVPVLRVSIAHLVGTVATPVIYQAMRTAFELINHYNRVDLARPDRSRFIQHITALGPDGAPAIVLVGMMHDAILVSTMGADSATTPTSSPTGPAPTPAELPDPIR